MRVREAPGGQYFRNLGCDFVVCKMCSAMEDLLEQRSLAHDKRKARKLYIHGLVTLYKVNESIS